MVFFWWKEDKEGEIVSRRRGQILTALAQIYLDLLQYLIRYMYSCLMYIHAYGT